MRSWQRILLGGLLVVAVAAAGIALNFALLGLAQDDNDPVGKLSPRAVFDHDSTTRPATTPSSTTPYDETHTTTDGHDHTTTDDSGHTSTNDSNDGHSHDHDDD